MFLTLAGKPASFWSPTPFTPKYFAVTKGALVCMVKPSNTIPLKSASFLALGSLFSLGSPLAPIAKLPFKIAFGRNSRFFTRISIEEPVAMVALALHISKLMSLKVVTEIKYCSSVIIP